MRLEDIDQAVSYGANCLSEEYEVLALSDESSMESDSDDESSLEAYDMSDEEVCVEAKLPSTLGGFVKAWYPPFPPKRHLQKVLPGGS